MKEKWKLLKEPPHQSCRPWGLTVQRPSLFHSFYATIKEENFSGVASAE